jgi:hypothetical protein
MRASKHYSASGISTKDADELEAYRIERERQETEMWKRVAEFFACDGTCDLCSTYIRHGKREERGTTKMGKCKPKPKKK